MHDPGDPYRAAEQRPQTELERLAAEGQRRHAALAGARAREANQDADDNLRVAIGGAFGTPLLRGFALAHYTAIAALLAFIALAVTKVLDETLVGPMIMVSGMLSFALIFIRVFWSPSASRAQVAAEDAWVQSLPFPMSGYFEACSARPSFYCQIQVEIELARSAPDPQVLQGVVRLVDPTADSFRISAQAARWRSGQISGNTNIRVNKVPVYRNHRIPTWVHALVDGALIPLHRDHPIAKVTLTRP